MGFCGWRGEMERGRGMREVGTGVGQSGDGVCVLGAEGGFLFGVALRFVADEGGGALRGDALEGVVDLAVHHVCDEAGGGGGQDPEAVGGAVAFGGGDEELAVDGLGGSEFPADAQLLFEPFHRFGTFERPDDVDLFGDGFAVAHLLDEVEELGDDSGDAASTSEEDDGVEGGEVALHAAVGSVEEGAVGFVGPFLEGGIENFTGEATKWPEDKGHVSVLLAVSRGKVVVAQRGDGEGVILEDGNAGHPEVYVLTWRPFHLSGDGDLDSVLRKDCHGGFFSYQPRHPPRVCPVEVEEAEDVGYEPDPSGGCEVVPGGQVVVAVPE